MTMKSNKFNNRVLWVQVLSSAIIGSVVACSPAKFSTYVPDGVEGLSGGSNCVKISEGQYKCDGTFKVGHGKVDILFINDNSASMSVNHNKIADKFSGFIQNLDQKEIDYQIAMITTDLNQYQRNGLVSFSNGSKIITRADSDRINAFKLTIARPETKNCENFMKSSYYTYGPAFQTTNYYHSNYYNYCPSNDERGLYAAYDAINTNKNGFIRDNSNLSVILISNEDVRSGLYAASNSGVVLDSKDSAAGFLQLMNSTQFSGKYWEFNSIIANDSSCTSAQSSSFKDKNNQTIRNENNQPVINSNIGHEYKKLSSGRGKILSICANDYTSHFLEISTQISDSSRIFTLKCTPTTEPIVRRQDNPNLSVPYQRNGQQLIFPKGTEGINISIEYNCSFTST